ncbi:hypothetical protein BGZ65_005714 [Modicella reniformis]|uniref:DNA ligase n=1 Tax=Modicella reniformis TaxID=1440133 RepID=A0A9P6SQ80_9FUNG|nr:hypothetical protein BGZ65_005714 [Modicella reniformis]
MAQHAQQVMLAHTWSEDIDPTGMEFERTLMARIFTPAQETSFMPPFFSQHLPKDQPLDGELWLGRGRFQQCVSIVKNQKADRANEWKELTYLVFDAPQLNMVYEKRLEYLKSIMPTYGKDSISTSSSASSTDNIPPYTRLVPVQKCQSKSHLIRELGHVQNHGGEGIMLRAPRSRYEFKRSRTLLKVKTFLDEEAIVVAHVKGSGKNSHRMGHIEVKTPDGRCFSIGSGFTDVQRNRPPKIGAIVTYKFQELSNKLNPRFPTFVGERIDMKWEDYCKTYKAPTLKAATPAKIVPLLKQASLVFQDSDDVANNDGDSGTSAFLNGDGDDSNENTNDSDPDENAKSSDVESDYTPPAADASDTRSNSSASSTSTTNRKRTHDQTLDTSTDKNDSNNDGDNKDSNNTKQEPCRYGENCYRRNPEHLKKFSHPPKRTKV